MKTILIAVVIAITAACGAASARVTVVEEQLDALGVNGVVRNDDSSEVRLVAVVQWLDAEGNVVVGVAAETIPPVVAPGATAEFGLLLPPDERRLRIARYRLTFEKK